jgi:hypothetical protein
MSLMIEPALSDHLLDTSSYIKLLSEAAQQINEASFQLILRSMVDNRHHLDPSTIQYFTRILCTRRDETTGKVIQPEHLHLPYFYILPKVHKNPWKTCPAVSAVASPPSTTLTTRRPPSLSQAPMALSSIDASLTMLSSSNDTPRRAGLFSCNPWMISAPPENVYNGNPRTVPVDPHTFWIWRSISRMTVLFEPGHTRRT